MRPGEERCLMPSELLMNPRMLFSATNRDIVRRLASGPGLVQNGLASTGLLRSIHRSSLGRKVNMSMKVCIFAMAAVMSLAAVVVADEATDEYKKLMQP